MKIKKLRKITVLLLVLSMCLSQGANLRAASAGTTMTKVLKYYKNKQYKKAVKCAKKQPETIEEPCVKKMSKKVREAYEFVIAKSPTFENSQDGGKYVWDYFLTDIDNDKQVELFRLYGSCEADVILEMWKSKGGKATKVCETSAGHSEYHAYPNHKGIIRMTAHMGGESISLVTVEKGKFVEKEIGSRYLKKGSYIELGCGFKSDYFSMLKQ